MRLPPTQCALVVSLLLLLATSACGGGGAATDPGGGGGGGVGGGSGPSDDANLDGLFLDVGALQPAFDAGTLTYAVGPGMLPSSVQLKATTAHAAALVSVDGGGPAAGTHTAQLTLEAGLNPIDVVVTAEDGVTAKTYTIVFQRAGLGAHEAYLKREALLIPDGFGDRVAIDGNTLAVGNRVFVRSGGAWMPQAILPHGSGASSVALSRDTLVLGDAGDDSDATGVNGDESNTGAVGSGAVHVYVRSGTTWTRQAYLKASNTGSEDRFGAAVAIDGNVIVVGAPHEASSATGINNNQSDDQEDFSGAAYVFVRNGTTWSQVAYVKASNSDHSFFFGTAVDISGETFVVGSPGERSSGTGVGANQQDQSAPNSGAAYVFVRSGNTLTQQVYVKASNAEAGDRFGSAVAIDGDLLVVGAPDEDSLATGVNGDATNNDMGASGAAYTYVRNGAVWTADAYLKASNTRSVNLFGTAVASSAGAVLVGSPQESAPAQGLDGSDLGTTAYRSGSAYLFLPSGGSWSQVTYLKAPYNVPGVEPKAFGSSVALDGGVAVIGAAGEDSGATGVNGDLTDTSGPNTGAAFVIR